jgi:hypothetical protein
METLTYQRKPSAGVMPKSPYNRALEHFEDRGRLTLLGHEAQPYTFADGTLAQAMYNLINHVRVMPQEFRNSVDIHTKDQDDGLAIRLHHKGRDRTVVFTAEPSLDDGILKYEGKVNLVTQGFPQLMELQANSKKAYRAIARKSGKIWYAFLTGSSAEDTR